MGGDAAPAPKSEPQKRDVPPQPPVDAGIHIQSEKSWYERNKNKNSIFEGDYWKSVKGIYLTSVLSASTKITLGWEHKNVVGGTATITMPFDNKFNFLFVLNYIFPVKDENTMGNKKEKITGIKISHCRGKKTKFVGADEVDVDSIEEAKKLEKEALHVTALEQVMAGVIEEEFKNLEQEHADAERTIQKHYTEYSILDQDIGHAELRTTKVTEKAKNCREEIDNAAAKYSGTFKSVAAAAHQINCDGTLEMTANGNASFVGNSLVSIGAALTNAG